MAASRPGNTDRGWNDPPVFDYQGLPNSSATFSESPRRTVLNKRVAYPLCCEQAAHTGTSTLLNPVDGPPRLPPVQILPPSTTTSTPTPVPLLIPSLSPTSDLCGDSGQQPATFCLSTYPDPGTAQSAQSSEGVSGTKTLTDLLEELSLHSEESLLEYIKDGLHSAAESVKQSLQGRALEDVKRKLVLMEEWWTAGKISETVKTKIGSLVAAIRNKCLEEAHELHLGLMINHTTEVNQWLVGVKHIIQEMQVVDKESVAPEGREEDEGHLALYPCLALEQTTSLQPSDEVAEGGWALSGPALVQVKEPKDSSDVASGTSPVAQEEPTNAQS